MAKANSKVMLQMKSSTSLKVSVPEAALNSLPAGPSATSTPLLPPNVGMKKSSSLANAKKEFLGTPTGKLSSSSPPLLSPNIPGPVPPRPMGHILPQQPSRPSGLATAKPQPKPNTSALGALLTQQPATKTSPDLNVVTNNACKPKVEAKSPVGNLSGANLSQNASTLNEKSAPPTMESKFNFSEESNSPKPAVPSQKPAPPGATFSASGVGMTFGNKNAEGQPKPSPGMRNAAQQQMSKSQDMKVKNSCSWSNLANLSMTDSPSTVGASRASSLNMQPPAQRKKPASSESSFEAFRKAAKEKEERERMHKEQEEMRKQAKERMATEHQRRERERQREREEEEALNQALKAADPAVVGGKAKAKGSSAGGVAPHAPSPSSQASAIEQQKERERLKEQERRRRAAMASQIDMNYQSELMASFEEML